MDIQKIKEMLGADEVMFRLDRHEVLIEAKIYDARVSCRISIKLHDLAESALSDEEYIVSRLKTLTA